MRQLDLLELIVRMRYVDSYVIWDADIRQVREGLGDGIYDREVVEHALTLLYHSVDKKRKVDVVELFDHLEQGVTL